MQYFLTSNAHSKFNLSQNQIDEINSNIGIHGNPASFFSLGEKARTIVETSREKIANLLNIKSENIFFANSCTSANYWALLILANHYYVNNFSSKKDYNPIIHISEYEHSSISNNLELLPFNETYKYPRNYPQNYSYNYLHNQFYDYSIHIGIQNETGIICDFDKIRKNTSKLFMSDIAQGVGKINIDFDKIDIATFGGHKFGGPYIGVLYLKDPNLWMPVSQSKSYMKDEPGSINVRAIYELGFALKNSLNKQDKSFQKVLEFGLENMDFEIIGKNENRIHTTTLAKVPKGFGIELIMGLAKYDIYVDNGSACGSFERKIPNSIKTLGYNYYDTELIRISQNGEYTEKDANYILKIVKYVMIKL